MAITIGLVLALLALPSALANGAPIKIPLTRLNGVVNFGAAGARGTAEIAVAEGDTTLTVTGLDRLTNELYQSWLVNTRTGERLSVAKFNVTADGSAKIQSIISLGNREFDLFVITVEPEPDPSPNPDDRIALAGYWPGREPAGPGPGTGRTPAPGETPAPTVPPGATIVSTAAPIRLPRTGGAGLELLGVALAGLGAGAWLLGRGYRR